MDRARLTTVGVLSGLAKLERVILAVTAYIPCVSSAKVGREHDSVVIAAVSQDRGTGRPGLVGEFAVSTVPGGPYDLNRVMADGKRLSLKNILGWLH